MFLIFFFGVLCVCFRGILVHFEVYCLSYFHFCVFVSSFFGRERRKTDSTRWEGEQEGLGEKFRGGGSMIKIYYIKI